MDVETKTLGRSASMLRRVDWASFYLFEVKYFEFYLGLFGGKINTSKAK